MPQIKFNLLLFFVSSKTMFKKLLSTSIMLAIMLAASAQDLTNTNKSRFKQLGQELPTPNVYRTASGAPGHLYWQQKVDYDMNIVLDDDNQMVFGEEVIKYANNSPDHLEYLWVQLDQNMKHIKYRLVKLAMALA